MIDNTIRWYPNDKSKKCGICVKRFKGLFRRRHHCRSCGILVCAACSPDRDYVQGYKDKKVRICKGCNTMRVKREKEIRKLNAFN
jgi:hypothetical protein